VQSASLAVYALIAAFFIHVNVLLYEEPNLRHKFGESYGG
jgi:protein-S-isoprenylcysteine O-methyltransferase Ste14